MREVQRRGRNLANPGCLSLRGPYADGRKINAGPVADALGLLGMPRAAEENGISRDIALAEALNTPLHICHVSTRGAVDMIRQAKLVACCHRRNSTTLLFIGRNAAVSSGCGLSDESAVAVER